MFVVPVLIPMGENIIIPNFFNNFIVDRTFIFLLHLLPPLFSSLYQYSSKIVDPFSSLLGGLCLEI